MIYLYIYVGMALICAILCLFSTYDYTDRCVTVETKLMPKVTWLIGGLFMGIIWPLFILKQLVDYFWHLQNHGY